ncbi:MAG: DUF2283 domain-containing protein [Calditrichaeota bacterium]|nr:MAG: DUF2283 domain-containing protein [Calditrichota bacterium]
MKLKYFADTDTLLFVFNENEIVETKDLDENSLIELDASGNLVSMTIEHAKEKTNVTEFSYQQIAS